MTHSLLRLHSDATSFANHAKWFTLHSISGSEGISELFRFQLVLRNKPYNGPTIGLPDGIKPPPPSADNDFWLGEEVGAEIMLGIASESRTFFHGVVTEYRLDGSGATVLQVEPKISLFRQRIRTRYFVDRFVGDVIREVLEECGLEKQDYRFTDNLNRKPLIAQYRESDTDFLLRLIAESGLCFVYEHNHNSHTMFIGQSPRLHLPCTVSHPKPTFRIDGTQSPSSPAIMRWQPYRTFRAGRFERVVVKADSPERTRTIVSLDRSATAKETQVRKVFPSVTQYPDDAEHCDRSADWGRTKIDAGGTYMVRPGELIEGPGVGDDNIFTIVRVQHSAQAGLVGNPAAYFNSFLAIPEAAGHQVHPVSRVRVDGPVYATVVAADGTTAKAGTTEISSGRVWLRFDDDTSLNPKVPVRLASGLGHTFSVPRIGQRVIVNFEDGLPDRPAIVAIAPHATINQLPHDPNTLPSALTLRVPSSGATDTRSEDTILQINDGRIAIQSPAALFAQARKYISLSTPGRLFSKAKSIFISGDDEIVLNAKKITLVAGSCKIVMDGDNIAIDCPGKIYLAGGGPVSSPVQECPDDGKPQRQ